MLQGKISNFDTDLFTPLIREAENFVPARYGRDPKLDASFRIVADHSRAATFLISDGVIPSNEGRGYVLRKIIRRALRHARMLDPPKPFLRDMVRRCARADGPHIPNSWAKPVRTFRKLSPKRRVDFRTRLRSALANWTSDLVPLRQYQTRCEEALK